MKLASLFRSPVSGPPPEKGQVPNSGGGHAFVLEPFAALDRFLILGSESGTYYASARALTQDNALRTIALIRSDGEAVVRRIVEISVSGRAPKNDPAIFALALAATHGDDATRAAALAAVPTVCRTGTHLFGFAEAVDGMRGWGRGLRRAVGSWYVGKTPEDLEHGMVKYARRGGWSHRDLLRLAHPVPPSDRHRDLFRWAAKGGDAPEGALRIAAAERIKDPALTGAEVAAVVREVRLPREALPSERLTDPVVWDALLAEMPLTAMVRNLATMTRVGLLTPGSEATRRVVSVLADRDRIRRARLHPLAILLAARTYASGRGLRSKETWAPVPEIVTALDEAFVLSFDAVEPAGKRWLLGIDVSASMGGQMVAGSSLTAAEAAAALAMVALRTEASAVPMAFCTDFVPLPLTPGQRLDDVLRATRDLSFGGTDCALPMLWARRAKLEVDVFAVFTDNETWAGQVSPVRALRDYREATGIPARLVVYGLTATEFTIADPADAGMLDVVGLDAAAPAVVADWARG